jgi:HEAT repeat protein
VIARPARSAGPVAALLLLSCALHRPPPPAPGRAAAPAPGKAAAPAASAPPPASPAPPAPPGPSRAERATQVLDQGLASGDLAVRGEALAALGASRRPGALATLGEALEDDRGELRFAAAQGLAALADPAAAPLLRKAWKGERGWAVRKELARAAGACGARDLLPELRLATGDPRRELAVAAAQALAALGDPAAEAQLARLGAPPEPPPPPDGAARWSRRVLAGEREGSRALAARTLADLGEPDDAAVLEPLLASDAAPERLWAAAAILRIGL